MNILPKDIGLRCEDRPDDCGTNPPSNHCFVAVDDRTLYHRLVDRLFTGRYLEIPEDLEGSAPSYMIIEVVAVLDWKDRLRMLWSGKLRVHTRTKTDVIVSRMVSESAVSVLPPHFAVGKRDEHGR
jgi:hypothetical protein